MVKKIVFFILLLLPFMCKAQFGVGDWKIHSIFGNVITNIIDTQDKVYYLVDKSLYVYDKEKDENESFNKRNKLSDILIKNIYYNYEKKYLVITYANSNIDFLYNDGKVVNLPDIKDVILTSSKGINDINFNKNRVYIATEFGYVIVNEEKHEVAESQLYYKNINSIAVVGDNLLISNEKNVYISELNKIHNSMESFTPTNINHSVLRLIPINNNSFFYDADWLLKAVIKEDKTLTLSGVVDGNAPICQPIKTGFIIQSKATSTVPSFYIIFDADGKEIEKVTLPEGLQKSFISAYLGNSEMWAIDAKGLKKIKMDKGNETVLKDYFKPNSSTVKLPYNVIYNNAQSKLYVMNIGSNAFIAEYGVPATINTYDGSFWTDITPASAPTINTNNNNKNILDDPYQPIFDPEDPSTYYVGTWFEGVYKIKDNKVIAKYDWTNSPMKQLWYCCVPSLQFDKNNNLWLIQAEGKDKAVMVLPRAKQSQASLSPSDWVTPPVPGFDANKKMHFTITKKNDLKIMTEGTYSSVLTILDDNGTLGVSSDDVIKTFSSLIDQDEKIYEWKYIHCFAEDKNGKLWMGTSNGVVEMNPQNAFSNSFRINRIKVPRNDGTSFADYLLENQEVTCIAVDGANRKWLGTKASGLFLVSADGSQILKHFTKSNSYLTDNLIISITCNPNSSSVYVGTIYGMVEYISDSTPAEDNYDNVYAFPNPVRPDYTGLITVRGLMENSLVKIADAAGNVFYSTRSTGGMITWDGCAANGERVKTGVYFVLASQNESGTSSGVVTKILVVN
ncbi:MAG: two-component regulator propeller domain-containing protein [Muribaculaceae bacterium]